MTDDTELAPITPLEVAVNKLARPGEVTTIVADEVTGEWLKVHVETHPSLLVLLNEGTGAGRASVSSEIRIPIDADALEIESQIKDLVRLWCKQIGAVYDAEDLPESLLTWHKKHADGLRDGHIPVRADRDVTRMVESWVRMITLKFLQPEEKREWTSPCPVWVDEEYESVDGMVMGQVRCGAQRIEATGKFAIELNVTTLTATCRVCGTIWEGFERIKQLRYETNVWEIAKKNANKNAKQVA